MGSARARGTGRQGQRTRTGAARGKNPNKVFLPGRGLPPSRERPSPPLVYHLTVFVMLVGLPASQRSSKANVQMVMAFLLGEDSARHPPRQTKKSQSVLHFARLQILARAPATGAAPPQHHRLQRRQMPAWKLNAAYSCVISCRASREILLIPRAAGSSVQSPAPTMGRGA